MKKINLVNISFYLVIGLLLTNIAFAIPKGPCDEPKDICCEETQGPFAFSYPKEVGLSCPRNFYLHGEFLWMKPTEEGLEYAISQNKTSNQDQFPLQVGKIKGFSRDSDEWDWRPGLRIGFGHVGMHDSWSFDANWTYIRIKSDSAFTINVPFTFSPFYVPPPGTALTEETISARWSGDYNTLDLMIGKPYHVSRHFISTPKFGVRAAWIDQDFHVRYFIKDNLFATKFNAFVKNDCWGAGLRGSYEAQFLLGSYCSIYGKAAAALLFSKFNLTQTHDSPVGYQVEYTFYRVKPNAELATGFSWGRFFNKNQYLVTLRVGYEFHHWWDLWQARRFFDPDPASNDTVSRGDLSFNGFMFGLNIDF